MIYLDYAASTPIWQEILDTHNDLSNKWFMNPHGTTSFADNAMQQIIIAERKLLKLLQIPSNEAQIIWTSGGTEANNLALSSLLKENLDFYHIDSTAHASQLQCLPSAKNLSANNSGAIISESNSLRGCVAICLVNNETGGIQDLVNLRKDYPKAIFAIDAIQAIAKTTIPWTKAKIDYLSLGGRKIGGPRNMGALIVRKNQNISPIILGGGQQKGLRSGTLDTVGILEFTKAVELTLSNSKNYLELNDFAKKYLSEKIGDKNIIFTSPENSSKHILSFIIPGYEAAVIVRGMAEKGIMIATGSACRAESKETNHVLKQMGFGDDLARGSFRFSFGHNTSINEIKIAIETLEVLIKNY